MSSPSSLAVDAVVDADEAGLEVGMWIFPTEETNAMISMPYTVWRYFSAMAPAATRPFGEVKEKNRMIERGESQSRRKEGFADKMILTDGLASRATSSTAAGLDAVFGQVGVVGVRRAGVQVRLGVVMRTLVLVLHEEADRGSEGNTVLDTGLDVDEILLVPLTDHIAGHSSCDRRRPPLGKSDSQEW